MKKFQNTVRRLINGLSKEDNKMPGANTIATVMDSDNRITRCTKSKLAEMYDRSVDTIMRKVHRDQELMKELKAARYNKWQKELTKEQVRIIYRYLGEPDILI